MCFGRETWDDSEVNLSGIIWVLFERTVGTLKLGSVGQLHEGIAGDHMATDQTHGRIVIRGLLPQDGTRKDWVEIPLASQVYFDRKFIFRWPNVGYLPLLHDLLDVEESGQRYAARIKGYSQRWFDRKAQKRTGISSEDITDFSPVGWIQEMVVSSVLESWLQVKQGSHQCLDFFLISVDTKSHL